MDMPMDIHIHGNPGDFVHPFLGRSLMNWNSLLKFAKGLFRLANKCRRCRRHPEKSVVPTRNKHVAKNVADAKKNTSAMFVGGMFFFLLGTTLFGDQTFKDNGT